MKWTTARSAEFAKRLRRNDLVIVPLGCIEAKGPHQPLGTDTLLAERLAEEIGDRMEACIAPTIPVGVQATGAQYKAGALGMSLPAYHGFLLDFVSAIAGAGFHRVLFVDGHTPNAPVVHEVANELTRRLGLSCYYLSVHAAFTETYKSITGSSVATFGHGGEVETSVLLHWFPELVDMDAARPGPEPRLGKPQLPIYAIEDHLMVANPNGFTGDPTRAGAVVGGQIVERVVGQVESLLITALTEAGRPAPQNCE